MRRNNKKLWIPLAVIAFCLAAVVVVCALLFTGKKQDGHLKIEDGVGEVRGELNVSLVRERLQTVTLDAFGFPETKTDERRVDFSKSKANIFGIDSNILIGPDCRFTADMVISNQKPYAFEYWLEIVPVGGDRLLADQLELTVEQNGEAVVRRTLQSGLTTKVIAAAQSGETSRFTVTLKYLDLNENDATKGTTLSFDMAVHARLI